MKTRLFLIGLSCFISVGNSYADETPTAREQIDSTLKLLQSSAEVYTDKRKCFTCHHQALPAMTVRYARDKKLTVDTDRAKKQSEFTKAYFRGRMERLKKGEGVPGGPYTAGYALVSLHADGIESDDVIAALLRYLETTQKDDGSWRIRTHRPPLEDSDFTATALSARALKLYGKQNSDRIERAQKWLLSAKVKTTEDHAFRLLGLHWCGLTTEKLQDQRKRLLAIQREDGGWSQLPDMSSDAYATGQALVALHHGGLEHSHTAFQSGLRFLKETRQADGSWHVKTRSKAIQKYFESGFPHSKDQFISISGTSWATMALILALD